MPDDDADMEEADALNHTVSRLAAIAGITAQQHGQDTDKQQQRGGADPGARNVGRTPTLVMPFCYPLLVRFPTLLVVIYSPMVLLCTLACCYILLFVKLRESGSVIDYRLSTEHRQAPRSTLEVRNIVNVISVA